MVLLAACGGPDPTPEQQVRQVVAALETALGEPVVGGILVRCVPDGPAEQIRVRDWPEALEEVRRALADLAET